MPVIQKYIYWESPHRTQPQQYPVDSIEEILQDMGVMEGAFQCTDEQMEEAVMRYELKYSS